MSDSRQSVKTMKNISWYASYDYLSEIRFICLAMTDAYIDAHFDDIRDHGSDIENRLDNPD